MSAILSADDLNDFISPGQACVKPPASASEEKSEETNEVELQVDDHGHTLEVSKTDGKASSLSPAQISLSDCLACSGCITSAEEILVAQHSHDELLKALQENIANGSNKHFVASISHQSRASLATAFNLTIEQIDRLLINLLVNQMGFKAVIGTSLGRKLSIINESYNIIQKKESPEFNGPLLSSICPGWVLYAEKTHPYIIPKMSDIKSPQQITGCLLKSLVSEELQTPKENIFHLSIMPCFDKKLESARPEKEDDQLSSAPASDVDCVLTAKELVTLLEQQKETFQLIPNNVSDILNSSIPIDDLYKRVAPKNWPYIEYAWSNDSGSASGGYSYNYLHILKNHLVLKDPSTYALENFSINTVTGKNSDIFELRLCYNDQTIASAAVLNGFRNIQNLVRKFKPAPNGKANTTKVNPLVARRKARLGGKSKLESQAEESADASKCDYVEIMACPNGCINGGGQISHPKEVPEKDWLFQALASYNEIPLLDLSSPEVASTLVPDLITWSNKFSTKFNVSESRLFKTWFKEVEKPTDPNSILLGAKW